MEIYDWKGYVTVITGARPLALITAVQHPHPRPRPRKPHTTTPRRLPPKLQLARRGRRTCRTRHGGSLRRDLLRPQAPAQTDGGDSPRRGNHAADSVGASMGGGQTYPQNLHHSVSNLLIFARLFGLKCFQRLAGWTNGWWPTYSMDDTLDQLFMWDSAQKRAKHLVHNFVRGVSVFTTATFNFGPSTVTLPHIDFGNLAWGWCCITALGPFDPDFGGHLVLWDLKLIIRFPPGATIFIPSAILRHSNVKIRAHEQRYSFTQFTPAGIFRWVYNGFQTDKDIEQSQSTTDEQREQRRADRMRRWEEGVLMYRIWKHSAKK
ncbi:hypothetical protein DFH07DRAFT_741523 [Mycena maculata]|uniref:Uncharacterized protein n=1 Tax=Mycena maculata TaxID=230809 RepID=A0AAD7J7H8_9AGAR|nr:hypothetical protein DFH07DRAFT_741523 [Mycena maculata]